MAIAHVKNSAANFPQDYIGRAGFEFIGWHAQRATAFAAATRLYENDRAVLGAQSLNQFYGSRCGGYAFGHR